MIAVGYPLSGPSASTGHEARLAVELAQDLVNNRVRLDLLMAQSEGLSQHGGARVRALFFDHRSDPARAASETERLIRQEKVAAVFGMLQNSPTASASQVAEKLGVPFVTADATSPSLHARNLKWFFRTTPTDADYSAAIFRFLRDLEARTATKVQRVGLTYDDTLYGQETGKSQREEAEKAGYKVVLDLQYRSRAQSLLAEVQQAKSADPDIWLPTAYLSDAVLLAAHAKELAFTPKLVVTQDAAHLDKRFLDQVGRDAEGSCACTTVLPDLVDRRPAARQLDQLLRERSGGAGLTDLTARVALGFLVLCDALNQASSLEASAVRQALRATDLKGDHLPVPWPGVRFDQATGQNTAHAPIVGQLQAGRFVTVWPFALAAHELRFPAARP